MLADLPVTADLCSVCGHRGRSFNPLVTRRGQRVHAQCKLHSEIADSGRRAKRKTLHGPISATRRAPDA